MPLMQFLFMVVMSLVVTVPVVLLIPRARTSPLFDRLLWAATVVVAFLVAWVGVGMAKDAGILEAPAIGGTPVVPVVIGALAGALALNLPLWLADQLGGPSGEEIIEPANPDGQTAGEDEGIQNET